MDRLHLEARDLVFFLAGMLLGAIFAFGVDATAQCCAQFDVPFNDQLEQERQMNLYHERNADIDFPRYRFSDPCVK